MDTFFTWTAVFLHISENNLNKNMAAKMPRLVSFVNIASLLSAFIGLSGCSAYKVIVSNPLPLDRDGEMIEVSAKCSRDGHNIVTDQDGKQLPYQITYDGKMIFQSTVKAKGKTIYKIHKGVRLNADTVCCGSFRADRMDDLMWENDKSGYRTYGPALQKSGERAYGYDVFTKSISRPVMKERFDKALYGKPRINFHLDHGDGMDSYGVGPTLGCGATALMHLDTLVYPWCWATYKILDNGPIRFTAQCTYSPVTVEGKTVIEKRLISVDKGSILNKVIVNYEGLGTLTKQCNIAVGIVIHPENPAAYRFDDSKGYIAYSDLGDRNVGKNGEIFCGAVRPGGFDNAGVKLFSKEELPTRNGAIGHVLGWNSFSKDYTYYFGSGWSKAGIQNLDTWEQLLKDFATKKNNPLQVSVKHSF
jgi:hypothetical protein